MAALNSQAAREQLPQCAAVPRETVRELLTMLEVAEAGYGSDPLRLCGCR